MLDDLSLLAAFACVVLIVAAVLNRKPVEPECACVLDERYTDPDTEDAVVTCSRCGAYCDLGGGE